MYRPAETILPRPPLAFTPVAELDRSDRLITSLSLGIIPAEYAHDPLYALYVAIARAVMDLD